MPPNLRQVEDFVKGYYDFALLHIDQQSIYEHGRGNSVDKGRLFLELKRRIQTEDPDLPIVVINHMTPFHDQYETHETVAKIKELVEGCIVINNSYTAADQWGFGETITHGLHAEEWGFDPEVLEETGRRVAPVKEPRAVIVMSGGGMAKAYRREFANAVVKRLQEKEVPIEWIGVTRKQFPDFNGYRDYLARSLVFFFPAWQSPRPRSRTEAMLSGCCIVTTPYHDADTFIDSGALKQKQENGRIVEEHLEYDDKTNGFLTSIEKPTDPRVIDNPDYTADLIRHLVIDKPELAREIGKRGQEYARKHFNHEHFEKQWEDFLKKHKIWKDFIR